MSENEPSLRPHPPAKSGAQQDLIEQAAVRAKAGRRPRLGEEAEDAAFRHSRRRQASLIVVLPVVVVMILAIAVPVWLSLKTGQDAGGEEAPPPETAAGAPAIDSSAVSGLSEKEVALAFLKARSWEERKRFVRNPLEVRARMHAYPDEVTAYPIPAAGLSGMGAVMPGGLIRYHRYGVGMEDGGRRLLCVVQTERGPRVDYDAFARYCSATWEELRDGQPAAEARLIVQGGSFYGEPFKDSAKWRCFLLTSPDWPESAWGYAETTSTTAKVLAQLVEKRPQRVTLALAPPESGSDVHPQFVIERVVADGWIRAPRDPESMWRLRQKR